MQCNAYKDKKSQTRCSYKCLRRTQFCIKHIRVKSPRLWVDNEMKSKIVLQFQKIWRGYKVRNYFRMLGTHVKIKKDFYNTEDLVTIEDSRIEDRFMFCENGKWWWFDIRTIHDWSFRNEVPNNPYTKEPLTLESRKRMREVISLRRLNDLEISHLTSFSIENKYRIICQILEEYGLSVSVYNFLSLTPFQITMVLNSINSDLLVWKKKKTSEASEQLPFLISQFILNQYIIPLENQKKLLANSILYMFRRLKNPYSICFIVASAIYRLKHKKEVNCDLNR